MPIVKISYIFFNLLKHYVFLYFVCIIEDISC